MLKEIDKLSSPNYLGDIKVVSGLLKAYVNAFLTREFKDSYDAGEYIGEAADPLRDILLGRNHDYPGPSWFSPDQLGEHVGKMCGYVEEEPETRVSFALIDLAEGLRELAQKQAPQWHEKSTEILARYTYILMGIPLELSSDIKPKKGCPLPTEVGDFLDIDAGVKAGDRVYIEQVGPQNYVIRVLTPIDAAGFTGVKCLVEQDESESRFHLVEMTNG